MTYRMAICVAIIFPVLCNAAESGSAATNPQHQPTIGASENPSVAAQPSAEEYEKIVKELAEYKKLVKKLSPQPETQHRESLENLLKELTAQSGIQQQEGLENLLKVLTTQSGVQGQESLLKPLSTQSGIQQEEGAAGGLFKSAGLGKADAQTISNATHEENADADTQLMYASQKQKLELFLIITVVIGALFWNKYLRLRCPSCGTARPELIRAEDVDSWLTPKMTNDRRSQDRIKPRSTSFTKVKRMYMCKPCGKKWHVVNNNRK